MMRVSIIATGIGNVVDIKGKSSKGENVNESLLRNVHNKIEPKFSEQTDLEDYTNSILEIKKNFTNKKADHLNEGHFQKKPTNIVLEFIKKYSPFKILGNKNDKEIPLNKERTPNHPNNKLHR